uniref:induced myeloid leukemia cell differentiation protein Mcl-1 homolog n=1 Tax=Myxine glutinosa TaxID=7769 RepID=UPI00358E8C2B
MLETGIMEQAINFGLPCAVTPAKIHRSEDYLVRQQGDHYGSELGENTSRTMSRSHSTDDESSQDHDVEHSSFLSATFSVTKAYVMHHVFPEKQRLRTPEADILCQIGDELLSKHEKAFKGMVRRLKEQQSADNGRFAAQRLRKVAEAMFSDREVNWGRIVALIVFCAVFSRDLKLNEQGPVEEEIDVMAQEVAEFIVLHDGWIRQQGGWGGFVHIYKKTTPETLLRNGMCAVAGFGAMTFLAALGARKLLSL